MIIDGSEPWELSPFIRRVLFSFAPKGFVALRIKALGSFGAWLSPKFATASERSLRLTTKIISTQSWLTQQRYSMFQASILALSLLTS
jgi:hypothetical protein